MTTTFIVPRHVSHPVDLANGVTLAPGEQTTELEEEHPHNAALIEQGNIVPGDSAPDSDAASNSDQLSDPEQEPEAPATKPKPKPAARGGNGDDNKKED